MASLNTIVISCDIVGLFIGPRGSNVKAMKATTGAKISVSRKPLRGGRFKLISVQGTRSERVAGMKAVKEWLESEKVQEVMNRQTDRKTTHYNRNRKLVVVEDGGWNTIVKGKGTAQERTQKHFWEQTQKECVSKLSARNAVVVSRLNKRTGFNWGDVAIDDVALKKATRQTIKARYTVKGR